MRPCPERPDSSNAIRPAETWSEVRNVIIPELPLHRQPRPLRAQQFPWGLAFRRRKELLQLATGAKLLLHTWYIEANVVLQGGGALKERPIEPEDDSYASTWRVPLHREWLMGLRHAGRHNIEQGAYGAVGVKPTCIRALNLGEFAYVDQDLRYGVDMVRPRPQQPLVGLNAQGQFRTSAAKEYPTRLAQSLAYTTICGLARRIRTEGTRELHAPASATGWFTSAEAAGAALSALRTFLPDYQQR